MKKRIVVLFLSLFLIMPFSLIFVACSEHSHVFGEWEVKESASCVSAEIQYRKCECGEEETKNVGTPLGHVEGDWIDESVATCADYGVKYKECLVCHVELERDNKVEKLPHVNSGWIVDQDSTCAKEGRRHQECTECGDVIVTESIDTKEHHMTEWQQRSEADCDHAEVLERHCITCETMNETMYGDVALGHLESDWITCLDAEHNETGYQEKICSRCKNRTNYSPKTYTITFNSNGGSAVASISQQFDTMVLKPEDPTRANHVFKGWFLDNGTFKTEFFTLMAGEGVKMPIGGATVYAAWEEINNTITKNHVTYRYLGNGEYEIVEGWLNKFVDDYTINHSIEYNIVSIADNAFYDWGIKSTYYAEASSFVDLVIPKTVRYIGDNAFRHALIKNVRFETGSKLESIGNYAFSDNILNTYYLRFPENLKSIGDYAFSSDNSDGNYMQFVYIPSQVENFGTNVFVGQKRLQRVICESSKITNNSNYVALTSQMTTLDVRSGEFTWVEDMLFYKDKTESVARLVYYNPSGLYTQYINDSNVVGYYEVIKMPNFKYDYVIDSFSFFEVYGIHCILFPSNANVVGINSYAFGNFKKSSGNPWVYGDLFNGITTPYPNFLFSSEIDWKNMALGANWLYLNNNTYCCVEIYGTSETKTNNLLDKLNNTLTIAAGSNKFCVSVEASIYKVTPPSEEDYKFATLLFGSLKLTKHL